MKKQFIFLAFAFFLVTALYSCCKAKKTECISTPFQISPYIENYGGFWCNDDTNYQYIFRKKEQIFALEPHCGFVNSMVFPIDDTDMVYILYGKTSYHYKDTFETNLFKDTCLKTLTYNVKMIQTSTTLNTYPGALQIYCSVEHIPADYQVEVKYQYVPK